MIHQRMYSSSAKDYKYFSMCTGVDIFISSRHGNNKCSPQQPVSDKLNLSVYLGNILLLLDDKA